MNDHNLSVFGSISMISIVARAIQDLRCDYVHSTCMASLARHNVFSMNLCARGCEPRETRWGGMAGSNSQRLLVESSKEALFRVM